MDGRLIGIETIRAAGSRPVRSGGGTAFPPLAQTLLAVALFLACVAPAAINGFPLVFPDSGNYVAAADAFRPHYIRAFGYSAFIRLTGGLSSLWLTVAAQAAVTAWVVTRAIALEAPRWPAPWRVPAVLGFLACVLFSHAPWLASWVQPDLLTGVMVLSLLLLVEHLGALGWIERVSLFGLLVGSVTVHLTHPPLAAGLGVAALGGWALARLRRAGPDLVVRLRRTVLLSFAAAALGWGALGTANYITYRSFTGSLGGPVFLFARLQADGDVAKALRPDCEAGKPWVACRFLDRFDLTSNEFLWRRWSPLNDMGFGAGFQKEAAELNPVLVRRVWPDWLAKSAGRTVRQLGRFELGDGMDDEGVWTLTDDLSDRGLSRVADAAERSLQGNDDLRPLMPRAATEALSTAGLAMLAALLVWGAVRRRPEVWWPAAFFFAAYLGNAALVSLGSDVFDRYAARLVWVAPLVTGVAALRDGSPPAPMRIANIRNR